MAERGTKTTFILSDSRRAKLKRLAAERETTATELLAEGVDLVLEKYRRVDDWQTLQRRAKEARERMRAGLFSGPNVSGRIDEMVYPVRRAQRRRR